MKIKEKIKNIVCTVVSLLFFTVVLAPEAHYGMRTNAEDAPESYEQTFIISAYYSPLPCQERYATGSYQADIRLNGSGVNSADGTPVYPGMIAAPKTYAFGTKMYIPGIGVVAVHDRGGAIVTAGNRGHAYDRLDIWMGYGDAGLTRALNWGKRTVTATVYGITDSVIEEVYLSGYTADEAVPNTCDSDMPTTTVADYSTVDSSVTTDYDVKLAAIESKFRVSTDKYVKTALEYGDNGESVEQLQKELTKLNYYRGEINGVFDEVTEHAVFKFQQAQGIVASESTLGAGYVGPQTRGKLNEIIGSRNYTKALIAQSTNEAGENLVAADL